jgi:UDP-N-acetylmuramoyl-L-alanyl-D-glutamate--2,6-diaminopimelate ligase
VWIPLFRLRYTNIMSTQLHSITLDELLAELPGEWHFPGNVIINGITSDSRTINKGDLFVALSGSNWDGHKFIPAAIEGGASVIVGSKKISDLPVPYIQVNDTRESLALLSAAFFRFPARELVMIGVTGTDGKTTTCNLIHSILTNAGYKAGVISTVNALIGDEQIDTGFHVTTPEAPDVQRLLRKMVDRGLEYAIIETTSHSLVQKRVIPGDFDIGVCTNITHEHLDYHRTFAAYQLAKASLFEGLASRKIRRKGSPNGAVINIDDMSFGILSKVVNVPLFSYGFAKNADFMATDYQENSYGSQWELAIHSPSRLNGQYPLTTRLFGKYNAYNCLASLAVAIGVIGIQVEQALNGVNLLKEIPGRMERIDLGQPFDAFVDFAHTPNALRQALITARNIVDRQLKPGKVIVVFGSAGLRDRGKRKLMTEVSAELANTTILTAEDPRTEMLASILTEMAEGMDSRGSKEGQDYYRIPDRGEAIQFAIDLANKGDIVLICGKGHEQSMCFGEIEYPWDDRIALRIAILKKLRLQTGDMPFLPTQVSPGSIDQ